MGVGGRVPRRAQTVLGRRVAPACGTRAARNPTASFRDLGEGGVGSAAMVEVAMVPAGACGAGLRNSRGAEPDRLLSGPG
jgi:hypothetical protein